MNSSALSHKRLLTSLKDRLATLVGPDAHFQPASSFGTSLDRSAPDHAKRARKTSIQHQDLVDGGVFWTVADGDPALIEVTYFDGLTVKASAIIHDTSLGTIGLVHILPTEVKDLETWIRDQIEAACYLRHLSLEATPTNEAHLCVEVVFITLEDAPGDAKRNHHVNAISQALRRLMKKSSLMHTIGVGILSEEYLHDGETANDGELHRAFPWLLSATRAWLESRIKSDSYSRTDDGNSKGSKRASSRDERLRDLQLSDFRLAGTRHLKLIGEQNLHLVHGYNGSGKSSISEALELLMTGHIRRIVDDPNTCGKYDYVEILRNRGCHEASPGITLNAREKLSFHVTPHGIKGKGKDAPFPCSLDPLSFRLDQHEAARLIRSSSEQRAAIYLKAFFPEVPGDIFNYEDTAEKVAQLEKEIPATLWADTEGRPELLDIATRTREAHWLLLTLMVPDSILPRDHEAGRYERDWEHIYQACPAYRNTDLTRLRDIEFTTPAIVHEYAAKLDRVWNDLRHHAAEYEGYCKIAASFLERLGGWRGRGRDANGAAEVHESYPARINAWLRECALCDLLEKELDLCRVLHRVQDTESVLSRLLRPLPEGGASLDHICALERELESHLHARDRAKAQVDLGEKPDALLRQGNQLYLRASPEEVQALNFISPLIFIDEESQGRFGDRVKGILESGEVTTIFLKNDLPPLVIGSPSSERENNLADSVLDFARLFGELAGGFLSPLSPSHCMAKLSELAAARRNVTEGLKEASRRFHDSVNNGLNAAINEFAALMTPARWAYPNLETSLRKKRLTHEVKGQPASLVLNTAELNTSVLSLFILCTFGRKDNPLRTIVLDDPFENLDELTTTQVARAFTRFLRLWRRVTHDTSWQILLLLHGAENVERMREEAPCAVYFLPWLSPEDKSRCSLPEGETAKGTPSAEVILF